MARSIMANRWPMKWDQMVDEASWGGESKGGGGVEIDREVGLAEGKEEGLVELGLTPLL